MEARGRIQPERDREPVGRDFDVLGEQAIHGGRLIERAGEQRLEDEPVARRRRPLQREGVELVDVGDAQRRHQRDLAALGRVRIHPLEVREALRILDVDELRGGVRSQSGRGGEERRQENHESHYARPGIDDSRRRV